MSKFNVGDTVYISNIYNSPLFRNISGTVIENKSKNICLIKVNMLGGFEAYVEKYLLKTK